MSNRITFTSASGKSSEPSPPGKLNAIKRYLYDFLTILVIVLLFTRFLFSGGYVPSSSMEPTLKPGDVFIRNKACYGGQTPASLGLPFAGPTIKGFRTYLPLRLPVWRMKGYDLIRPGDVLTFNASVGKSGLPPNMTQEYVKRCVAIAGDKVYMKAGMIYVNDSQDPACKKRQYKLKPRLSKPLPKAFLEACTLHAKRGVEYSDGSVSYELTLSYGQLAEYRAYLQKHGIFPLDSSGKKTGALDFKKNETLAKGKTDLSNDFDLVEVPYKGMQLALSKDTHPLYLATLENREPGFEVEKKGEDIHFYLNNQEIDSYEFPEDHLLVTGDNLHDSVDSRIFGFIGNSQVSARVTHVLLSLKGNRWYNLLTFNLRWDRFFKQIT